MRNIIVTEFITLDGVIEAPEKWSFPYWNAQAEAFKHAELEATGGLLLGRLTYEGFAAAWPGRSGAFAERMNSLPKYVASHSLSNPSWQASEVLQTPLPEAIAKLKAMPGQDIVLHGSATLAQDLIEHNLVDRYHLLLYPIVAGEGKRLFRAGQTTKLKLVGSTSFDTGVVALTYQPEGAA
jgi:dihydrofolate reductase